MVPVVVATGTIQSLRGATTEAFITSGKVTKSMVPQNGHRANRDGDLSWEAMFGKPRFERGYQGLGLKVACWIADELGYAVLSMVPLALTDGKKNPYEKWKYLQYRTPLQIRGSTSFRSKKCGVSVMTGVSGLVVIDIDNDDGEEWLRTLADGREIKTRILQTHKGRHLIFLDGGIDYKTTRAENDGIAPGVDIRGRGGIELVYDPGQPERHFTDLTEPVVMPDWLAAEIPLAGSRSRAGKSGSGKGDIDEASIMRNGIPHGEHNSMLLRVAQSFVNKGWRDREAWYAFARSAILIGGDECDCTDEHIYGWFDSALENVEREDAELKESEKAVEKAALTQSFDQVPDLYLDWIWDSYAAKKILTQIDGEKTHGKTFIMADVIARATRGWPMPGQEEAICDPMDVFLFAEDLKGMIKKRLQAARADLSRVHYPDPEWREAIVRAREIAQRRSRKKRTKEEEDDLTLLLPDGAKYMLQMIGKTNSGLVIWDPITDYLGRTTSQNSDAEVRRALEPISRGLEKMDTAGISIRHMSKDRHAAARHRGSGTTAFQNVARVHLVTGRLSEEYADRGTFGLSMVAGNYVVEVTGTLVYNIVDSDIKLDKLGHMVGKVEWCGLEEDIDADSLAKIDNGNGHRGPAPTKNAAIKAILIEMGEINDTWDSVEGREYVHKKLEEQGHDVPNRHTVDKARTDSFIRVVYRKGEVGGKDWIWPAQRVSRVRA